MYVVLHLNRTLFLSYFSQNREGSTNFSKNYENMKFHDKYVWYNRADTCGQRETHDWIVTFCTFFMKERESPF